MSMNLPTSRSRIVSLVQSGGKRESLRVYAAGAVESKKTKNSTISVRLNK